MPWLNPLLLTQAIHRPTHLCHRFPPPDQFENQIAMLRQVIHQPFLHLVVAETAGITNIGHCTTHDRRAVENVRHAQLQRAARRIKTRIETTESTKRRSVSEPCKRLVKPVIDPVIQQPGLHQFCSMPFRHAWVQLGSNGFRALIGQLLQALEASQVDAVQPAFVIYCHGFPL